MKKLTLLFVLVFIIQSITFSQPCPDSLYITTQAQIDSFQINYPGCTEIEGKVFITGYNISNLNGLNVLTYIGEGLSIFNTDILTSLTGLNNLDSIGGNLFIFQNQALNSLMGIENLASIEEGFLEISANNNLTTISGLANLTFIGGDLRIIGNSSLNNLTGLENLKSIEGKLWIQDSYLSDFTGLDSLYSIGGDISIFDNYNLISLTGLENLDPASIDNMTISRNFSLSTCEVQSICDYLSSPNGIVEISLNGEGCNSPGEIANFCEFPMPCLPFGNYHFTRQSDIDSFQSYYPECTELEGHVIIGYEYLEGGPPLPYYSDIINLAELNVVTSIQGDLQVLGNVDLTSLEGLEGLMYVGGALTIGGSTEPVNIALTSLTGLENLSSIGGSFIISKNPNLVDLLSLEALSSIGGALRIGGGDFGWNFGNNSLINLSGLDNIDAASIEDLVITNNNSLSICEVQSICDYLADPNGIIDIQDNYSGCNSQLEVEEACDVVSVDENKFNSEYSLYPNPATNQIFITSKNGLKIETVNVYNQLGQKVLYRNGIIENIDISTLGQGIYIIELTSSELKIRQKLIIEE